MTVAWSICKRLVFIQILPFGIGSTFYVHVAWSVCQDCVLKGYMLRVLVVVGCVCSVIHLFTLHSLYFSSDPFFFKLILYKLQIPFVQPVKKLVKTGDNGKLFVAEICGLFVHKVGKNPSLGHG